MAKRKKSYIGILKDELEPLLYTLGYTLRDSADTILGFENENDPNKEQYSGITVQLLFASVDKKMLRVTIHKQGFRIHLKDFDNNIKPDPAIAMENMGWIFGGMDEFNELLPYVKKLIQTKLPEWRENPRQLIFYPENKPTPQEQLQAQTRILGYTQRDLEIAQEQNDTAQIMELETRIQALNEAIKKTKQKLEQK